MQPNLTAIRDSGEDKPCESLVVILSNAVDDGPDALDSSVSFNSAEGGLLIFYVGEAIV